MPTSITVVLEDGRIFTTTGFVEVVPPTEEEIETLVAQDEAASE